METAADAELLENDELKLIVTVADEFAATFVEVACPLVPDAPVTATLTVTPALDEYGFEIVTVMVPLAPFAL